MLTLYLGVLSLSNLLNHCKVVVFSFKAILGIKYQRFYSF